MRIIYTFAITLLTTVIFGGGMMAQQPQMVADLKPGADGFFIDPLSTIFAQQGDTIYFSERRSQGYRIWISDGTEAGTMEIGSIPSGDDFTVLGKAGSNYLIRMEDENTFYALDPLSATLELIHESSVAIKEAAIFQDELFLIRMLSAFEDDLVRLDMQSRTMDTLHTFEFGSAGLLMPAADYLLMIGLPNNGDLDMWLFKYQDDNFEPLRQFQADATNVSRTVARPYGNQIFFWYYSYPDYHAIWTDGTVDGTILATDELKVPPFPEILLDRQAYFHNDDFVFFTAVPDDACSNCYEVYIIDKLERTILKLDMEPGDYELGGYYHEYNGKIYFHQELWFNSFLIESDGSAQGTRRLNGDIVGYNPRNFEEFRDTLYYSAYTDDYGNELRYFLQDGFDEERVYDINPGTDHSSPRAITAAGDKLYFIANDGEHGSELFVLKNTTTPTSDPFDGQTDAYHIMMKGSRFVVESEFQHSLDITILDMAGRALSRGNFNTNHDIDPGLPAGMYLIKVEGPEGMLVKKVYCK